MNSDKVATFLEVSEQQGELVDWLREYAGFCPTSPTVSECLEKFPLLDRERVDQAIRQVREEQKVEGPMSNISDEALEFILDVACPGSTLGIKDYRALTPKARAEVRLMFGRIGKGVSIREFLKLSAGAGITVVARQGAFRIALNPADGRRRKTNRGRRRKGTA
jgi:hypothetical protein